MIFGRDPLAIGDNLRGGIEEQHAAQPHGPVRMTAAANADECRAAGAQLHGRHGCAEVMRNSVVDHSSSRWDSLR